MDTYTSIWNLEINPKVCHSLVCRQNLFSPSGPGSPGGPWGPGSPGVPFPGEPCKPVRPGGPGSPSSPIVNDQKML